MTSNIKNRVTILGIVLLLLIIVIASFCMGRYSLTLSGFFDAIHGLLKDGIISGNNETVLFKLRLPRIFSALLIGGALSTSGAVYQNIFKNPLVSPGILGASAGAGLGACIAIIISQNILITQTFAFMGGLSATGLTCFLSNKLSRDGEDIYIYVLIGMVMNAVLQAGISITKYVADPYNDLKTITFWLMGGLTDVKTYDLLILLVAVTLGMIPLMLNRWKINLLNFDDNEIEAMGVDVKTFRIKMIIAATLLSTAAVAVGGMIGWVGLVIPHITRMVVGPNNKLLIPASFLIGGTYFLIIDDLARSIMAMEIPLGILTAAIGAPVFISLLLKGGYERKQ